MDILLIEDNETIVRGLEYAFSKKEYRYDAVYSMEDAMKRLEYNRPKMIILDIALPDGNGLEFYKKLIKPKGIPTIFLTAQDDEDIIVQGLDMGADDYVTKPFSTKELMARIQKVILRNRKETVVRIRDVTFDMDKMIVTRGNEVVELTSLERRLLHLLFLNKNIVVRRNTILDKIWEWTGNDVDDHTVTVYMKRIRSKIGNEVITTVKGIGYRVDEHEK